MRKPVMPVRARAGAAIASVALAALTVAPAASASPTPTFTSSVFASAATITHPTAAGSATVSGPDDLTMLDGSVYVAFQNGVGPQGQPSATGNSNSTVVEFDGAGHELGQWDVVGKVDGMTADPGLGSVIATVNEDANSSLYLINPASGAVHYSYAQPLAHGGGTDSIAIYDGMVLISASAPGTSGNPAPQPSYPAVYIATFDNTNHTVSTAPLFYDESLALTANIGGSPSFITPVTLALTDPDSSEVVPMNAPRFRGTFMLDSQGDQQQIFVRNAGTAMQRLWVLNLSASINDTAWPSSLFGKLLVTDGGDGNIYEITGPFHAGQMFVAVTPCDSNNAPSTCPGPGYPANYLGLENPYTGMLTPVTLNGPVPSPGGMLFVPMG